MNRIASLYLFISLLLFSSGFPSTGSQAVAGKQQAVLNGGFWQLGPELLEQFTDEELAREVGYMKELGMNIIIIQYSVLPFWKEDRTTQTAYVENSVYAVDPAFQDRQPFDAIFKAAEQHGVKVVLGGLLMPMPFEEEYEQGIQNWISDEAMQYRRELIERFSAYDSFYGWYTPNEPNPAALLAANADLALMRDATDKVTKFVKSINPDLVVIKSIGLYLEPTEEGHKFAFREYLDQFWRPWVQNLDSVDAWMVIDGVGTELSNLEHTRMAQEWARDLSREFGKDFWVDVENAHMNDVNGVYVSKPFTIEELEASLRVAAQYGTELVTFDYIHYQSRQSPKPEARKLHTDYQEYIKQFGVGE